MTMALAVINAIKRHRSAEIYQMRMFGAPLREVGLRFGISRERARQIVASEERHRQKWFRPWRNLRPLDMGGPRDVWMIFTPGPDPRLDWQIPATAVDA